MTDKWKEGRREGRKEGENEGKKERKKKRTKDKRKVKWEECGWFLFFGEFNVLKRNQIDIE